MIVTTIKSYWEITVKSIRKCLDRKDAGFMDHKTRLWFGLALLAVAGAVAEPVLATTVTETYSFDLGNFVSTPGTVPSTLTDISATFTVTFDPTVGVLDQATGLTVDSLKVQDSGGAISWVPLVFTYIPNDMGSGINLLSIGGTSTDGTSLNSGTNDLEFFAIITNLGAPSLVSCTMVSSDVCGPNNVNGFIGGYTLQTDSTDSWHPATGVVSAVPLPAAGWLLLSGLGGLGFLRHRRSVQVNAV